MSSTIDHLEFAVSNSEISHAFYSKALACLGIECLMEIPKPGNKMRYGFGSKGYPFIWFHDGNKIISPIHIALKAKNRKSVIEFFDAACMAGGKSNGEPGIREHYHSSYFAAYVLDPDGNNIEVVFQGQETK